MYRDVSVCIDEYEEILSSVNSKVYKHFSLVTIQPYENISLMKV